MIKSASYFINLHSFVACNGEPVEFSVRILANRLQYSIIMLHQYCSSSFYDGNSFEDAFDFYIEIISALLSVTDAERVKKMKLILETKAKNLLMESASSSLQARNHLYFKKPLFLGISEAC